MTVEKNGDAVTASTSFAVPYQDWGMKNPSKAFLHVDGKVDCQSRRAGQRRGSLAFIHAVDPCRAPGEEG
jgi:hypothetical protein